ncbi:MAG: hypothetical protein RL756_2202 [Pseudomonadota bacterium]
MVTPGWALPNCGSPRKGVPHYLTRKLLMGALLMVATATGASASESGSAGTYSNGSDASGYDPDDRLAGPDIRIILEEERTLYEFRQNGQLRMVRVEPRLGKPYYLVPRDPTKGFGDLMRADMLLPSWVLVRF